MDELWEQLFERLTIALRQPENLVMLVSALERIQKETGHGAVHIVLTDRRLELINYEVKQKAANGK